MNTFGHDHDLPAPDGDEFAAKLTAFALGELPDDECVVLETKIAADPALQAEVDGIRAVAQALSGAYAAEPGDTLGSSERAAIADGPETAEKSAPVIEVSPSGWTAARFGWAALATAAAVTLVTAVILPKTSDSGGDNVAMNSESTATTEEMSTRVMSDLEGITAKRGDPTESFLGGVVHFDAPPANESDVARDAVSFGITPSIVEPAAPDQSGVVGESLASLSTPAPGSIMVMTKSGSATGGSGGGGGGDSAGQPAGNLGLSRGMTPNLSYERGRVDTRAAGRERAAYANSTPPPAAGARRSSRTATPADGYHLESHRREIDADEVLGRVQDPQRQPPAREKTRDSYGQLIDNPWKRPDPVDLSTFSVDVDTASYTNVRRMINGNMVPPADSIRIEEFINYFSYDYPQPEGVDPFSVSIDAGPAPWQPNHRLVRIGLQGLDVSAGERPDANIVFLLDVSGSMNQPMKLPLVKSAMRMLIHQLAPSDRVAIVVYAGAAGLVLDSTTLDSKGEREVLQALERLRAGGSTNGGQGIELAYQTAVDNFVDGGVNRVILCTDGDFNVGTSGPDALQTLIEGKRDEGVFLSVLGFGSGNFQDDAMERLSNHGNGTAAYIDSMQEARKVLVEEVGASLVTIAKDVKIQVDFNPARVKAFRLIGYANRMLPPEAFSDDSVDAGEIGAGHSVTALYEIVPVGEPFPGEVEASKYVAADDDAAGAEADLVDSPELLEVRLRYKQPDGDESKLIKKPFVDSDATLKDTSSDFRHAASVAAFGMKLRGSVFGRDITWKSILDLGLAAAEERDPKGYRMEFLRLVESARYIAGDGSSAPKVDD